MSKTPSIMDGRRLLFFLAIFLSKLRIFLWIVWKDLSHSIMDGRRLLSSDQHFLPPPRLLPIWENWQEDIAGSTQLYHHSYNAIFLSTLRIFLWNIWIYFPRKYFGKLRELPGRYHLYHRHSYKVFLSLSGTLTIQNFSVSYWLNWPIKYIQVWGFCWPVVNCECISV